MNSRSVFTNEISKSVGVSHFQPHPRLGNFYTFEIYISKMQDLLSQLHKQADLIKTSLESLTAIKSDTMENTIVDHKIFGQAPQRGGD